VPPCAVVTHDVLSPPSASSLVSPRGTPDDVRTAAISAARQRSDTTETGRFHGDVDTTTSTSEVNDDHPDPDRT
jgi:hypothetical protein